jgi:hypothetical protein
MRSRRSIRWSYWLAVALLAVTCWASQLLGRWVGRKLLGLAGTAVHTRAKLFAQEFDRSFSLLALQHAIKLESRSIELTPIAHPSVAARLDCLSGYLSRAYERTGYRAFLDESVVMQRRAVERTPQTSRNRPVGLSNLAVRLASLYEVTQDSTLLDEAVLLQRSAVALTPPESGQSRAAVLGNLALWLSHRYTATGNLVVLQESVLAARQSVAACQPPDGNALDILSCRLADLYEVTGSHHLLVEAVELQRQAVDAARWGTLCWASRSGNLANRLLALYRTTPDLSALLEAIEIRRQTLQVVPDGHVDRTLHLGGLSNLLTRLYETTGDRSALREAVDLSSKVLLSATQDRLDWAAHLHNHALGLAHLFEATGDKSLLREALKLTVGTHAARPKDRFMQARTRAHLARLSGDVDSALHELHLAYGAFEEERKRLADEPSGLRDLAAQVERVLGDLVGCYAARGDHAAAVRTIEAGRHWLTEPPVNLEHRPALPPIAVAWVAASRWETVVISAQDHRAASYTVAIMPTDRQRLGRMVIGALNGTRLDAVNDALEELMELTARIVDAMPHAARLLVVPLGPCALLPFNSASHSLGGQLIDHTAVTIAPTLGWALASHRSRPEGDCLGVFDPGEPPLDLSLDEEMFVSHFPEGIILNCPTPSQVLGRLSGKTTVLHLACHGSYDIANPLLSSLQLNGSLTIRQLMDAVRAPWLVNLSACETGMPDLARSEQSISFPTCFLRGGAAHVIASQWAVANDYASQVNATFYDNLGSGLHPAVALQNAVLSLRSSSTPNRVTPRSVIADPELAEMPIYIGHPLQRMTFSHYGSPW